MKKIKTEFGELEIKQEDIIHFEEGLYGFETTHDYVLINHDEQGIIMTMQTINGEIPQFIVLDPFAVINNYNPKVLKDDLHNLGVKSSEDLKFLVIAVVKEDFRDTVVNLKSPITINPKNNKASQVILENDDYSMRYPIFNQDGGK